MKVHPTKYVRNREDYEAKAGNIKKGTKVTERITKIIALIVAFGTVYFFFFKILFF